MPEQTQKSGSSSLGSANQQPNRGGRPEHEPTDAQRKNVSELSGFGVIQEDIAKVIGISAKTLRLHYPEELELSAIHTNSAVVQSHYQQCVGRPAEYDKDGKIVREEIKPNITAIIWWEKARMKWKETSRHEHTGENGGPVQYQDLSGLTDEQLEQLEAMQRALAEAAVTGDDTGGEG